MPDPQKGFAIVQNPDGTVEKVAHDAQWKETFRGIPGHHEHGRIHSDGRPVINWHHNEDSIDRLLNRMALNKQRAEEQKTLRAANVSPLNPSKATASKGRKV